MSKFTTEAKVGIFVLIGILLLGYMTLKVGRFEGGRGEGILLEALFDTASGLKKGVPVEIAGIDVGTVEEIALEKGRALIKMRLRPGLDLGVDSQALIRTSGVLGDKYIEIIPGLAGAPILKDGERIIQTQSPADLDQLLLRIGDISDDIKRVTQTLSSVFGGEEGASNMRDILNNFQEMSRDLTTMVSENRENLNAIIENLTRFSRDMQGITTDNRDEVDAIMANMRQLTADLIQALTSFREIAEKVNRGEGTLGALVNDNETSQSLNQALAQVQEITEKINEGKGSIGRLINSEDTIDMIDESLGSINKYLSTTEAMKFKIDYHTDYLFESEAAKSYVNLRIQSREDRYYLLGLVSDPEGAYSKTTKSVTDDTGAVTTTVTEEWDESTYKFNAQIAKRYEDFVIRGGLIESSAGLGADYYLLNDDLKFTLEAFDFNNERNKTHLKIALSYDFFNIFYINAGYDRFNDKDRGSAFLGFGLKFYDDDLKYLLSSLPLP